MDRCMRILGSPCFPVVLGLFLHTMFYVGTLKAVGIFLDEISMSLNTKATDIGFILGLFSLTSYFLSPIAAIFYRRFPRSRRLPLSVGAALTSLGTILASFATNKIQLSVFLAISGLGNSVNVLYLAMVLDELSDNYNLLFCFAVCGYGFGMVIPTFTAQVSLTAYGWRGGMLVLGALEANLLPCALAVRSYQETSEEGISNAERKDRKDHLSEHGPTLVGPWSERCPDEARSSSEPTGSYTYLDEGAYGQEDAGYVPDDECPRFGIENEPHTSSEQDTTPQLLSSSEESSSIRARRAEPKYTDESAALQCRLCYDTGETQGKDGQQTIAKKIIDTVQNSPFYTDPWLNLNNISAHIDAYIYVGWHAFLIPHALERGISPYHTLIITFFAAIGNISGRVAVGLLTRRMITPVSLYLLICPINVPALLGYAYSGNLAVMALTSFVSALCVPARAVLPVLIGKGRAPAESYSTVFMAYQVSIGSGVLIGGWISGLIADRFSSYDATFKLLAALEVPVFFTMLPLRLINNRQTSALPDE